MRVRRLIAGLVVAAVAAVLPVAPASGDPACRAVFAVAEGGQLHELARCAGVPELADRGVVDDGDWRVHRWVTAAVDGGVTTFWTVGPMACWCAAFRPCPGPRSARPRWSRRDATGRACKP